MKLPSSGTLFFIGMVGVVIGLSYIVFNAVMMGLVMK